MKRTLGFYLRLAVVMLLFFALWKPVFMLFNGAAGRGCGAGDFLSVIMHGLPLDLATTGYTLALPLLLLLRQQPRPLRQLPQSPWKRKAATTVTTTNCWPS